jgi:hypothetical protein
MTKTLVILIQIRFHSIDSLVHPVFLFCLLLHYNSLWLLEWFNISALSEYGNLFYNWNY